MFERFSMEGRVNSCSSRKHWSRMIRAAWVHDAAVKHVDISEHAVVRDLVFCGWVRTLLGDPPNVDLPSHVEVGCHAKRRKSPRCAIHCPEEGRENNKEDGCRQDADDGIVELVEDTLNEVQHRVHGQHTWCD